MAEIRLELRGAFPHQSAFLDCPKRYAIVERVQVWKMESGRHFRVSDVREDGTVVVNYGGPSGLGETKVATVLRGTLVPKPSKAVLAELDKPFMEFSFSPKRRRK